MDAVGDFRLFAAVKQTSLLVFPCRDNTRDTDASIDKLAKGYSAWHTHTHALFLFHNNFSIFWQRNRAKMRRETRCKKQWEALKSKQHHRRWRRNTFTQWITYSHIQYSQRRLRYPQWRINNSNQYVATNETETADIILLLLYFFSSRVSAAMAAKIFKTK